MAVSRKVVVSLGFRYTEVNSGQVVDLLVPPFYLDGLARWVRVELDGVAAVEAVAVAVEDDSVPEPVVSVEVFPSEDAAPEDAAEPEAHVVPESDVKPSGTTSDDRDEWVTYALAHGKTAADVKGIKVKTIASWFADN